MEDDRRVNGNGKAEELRSEQGEALQDASGDRGRDKVGDRERSPSPVPSPASSSGRGRGRSRTRASQNFSVLADDQHSNRRGYHALISSFGKVFHVEKRWKLIREMGSGAYGFVISAADEISGEPVAIKMVTRAVEKVQLAKRALREITLLRFFSHENITGLIDVDCTPDLNEIYIFMEPMEADLHQIIKSGQLLTNEHVQYFVYQILRGMKYIHTASVVHRDLKPGNLLVNADCELKICDFGLSRGFESSPDDNTTSMTEYVATRWYRAPEIMLAYKGYNTAIDIWSIGCIMAELILGRPLFKGKDYVDQLNKILEFLGTPEDEVIARVASPRAQAYIRSLPKKKPTPFHKILPTADIQALDLLFKMLKFDPAERISASQALEHPWLSSYHDVSDEPSAPAPFQKWRDIEALETLDQFREALWNEIQDCRREVRSVSVARSPSIVSPPLPHTPVPVLEDVPEGKEETSSPAEKECDADRKQHVQSPEAVSAALDAKLSLERRPSEQVLLEGALEHDPVVTYVRRTSFMQPSRRSSTYSTHSVSHFRAQQQQSTNAPASEGHPATLGTTSETITTAAAPLNSTPIPPSAPSNLGSSTIAFPTQEYVIPARSRTASMMGSEPSRKLLRTLSTVSIYESGEGRAGGLADIAPIGRYIVERDEAVPDSEMPRELMSPQKKDGQEKHRFHIE